MAANEIYTSTARALAQPFREDDSRSPLMRQSTDRPWTRRRVSEGSQRPRTQLGKALQQAEQYARGAVRIWNRLSLLQKGLLIGFLLVINMGFIFFLVYHEAIFGWLAEGAKQWRSLPGGWLILWLLTVVVAFPPLIGYSTCVTIAGFVWGMYGWLIVASATIVGSTLSFLASRSVLQDYVKRWTQDDKRFAALSLVLKHDGLKLLAMIRVCPLPYSLSNGAISTIPSVTWYRFALATAIASPKLLVHVFVGRQIGLVAETGDKMTPGARAASYIGIAVGVTAGLVVGYLMYVKTKARAEELEAEEVTTSPRVRRSGSLESGSSYLDDPRSRNAANVGREDDDISLHSAYMDNDGIEGYRDHLSGNEEANDVFAVGDGLSGDEEEGLRKAEK